ncbi:vegetatible incompatibility het-E-1 [Fusarium pseudocircinatum]|uniref:Vegetatible incompatibility het-E-1 n=1 Tax=Fusarium pseudocircinatum TaxID=56676 RepID=A0A8H5KRB7_9HYPO|nr:vegetatible incompatibility het-E-1 [Fusarium pseudocircinatum]
MSGAMNMQKAVNAAGRIEIGQQINNVYDTDGRKDSCLEDLYITDPIADKQRIEDDKGGLLKDCYNWILENENFIKWRDDPHCRLLWIKGDPGKGKTMLLAGLITEFEKTSDDGIFYFFCQATQPLLRTASYVLRGLIWSIVRKRPVLISYVRKEYNEAGKSVFSNHNAWQAVSRILTAILDDEISKDYTIIIDALDECTEGRDKLIGYISQCSISCKAKWVISSRNWPEIELQLDETQRKVRLHLELNHAAISNAVIKFVDQKIIQLNSTYNEPARARIRKHLLDNANDTFLWVALVCQELQKPGVRHYHSSSILKRFPAGLSELYERMISDINDRDIGWCRAILAVVAVALRPPGLQELAAADATLTEWIEDKETLSSLVKSCGSLLTIRGDKVYTVHQSVNDFLQKAPNVLPSGVGHQHYSIFNCSMNIMHNRLHRNLYELKESCVVIDDITVLPSAPLTIAGYACVYWVDHFCACLLAASQHQNSLCHDMITHFMKNKYLYWLEAMSLLRCTSKALEAMQRLEDKMQGGGPDELKLLVKDAVRFAFTHRTIMDVAPLQLYDSALIFTPQFSKIKGCFIEEISKSIDIFSPDFQHWDACFQTFPGIAGSYDGSAVCEFSPNGRQIATINSNHDSIFLIDASTGGLVKSIEPGIGRLRGFTFHPSGDSLVTLSDYTKDEKKLAIFHVPSEKCSKSITVRHSDRKPLLALSLDGQLLALVSDPHTVDIWDTASGIKMDSCNVSQESYIEYIAWIYTVSHPQVLLILESLDISIWGHDRRHQMSKLMSLMGNGYPNAAAVSRDRARCVVCQDWKKLLLYSWGSSITVREIAHFKRTMIVRDLLFVADDRSIALCGTFGIEIWDLEAKRFVAQVRGDSTEKICYGENRQLASLGFRNGTLKIWSLDMILSHSEPTTQQSASIARAFIPSPSGKVALIGDNGEFDILSIAVDGRIHHFPKTLQHSPRESYYRIETLVFGHGDYFAVVTDAGAVNVFNIDHDTGLYYCERRLGKDLFAEDDVPIYTAQFWRQEQIITRSDHIRFWDIKTGKCLRKVPISTGRRTSTITSDGRIAVGDYGFQVVIWDIMCGEKMQCFDLDVLQRCWGPISEITLDSSMLAISGKDWLQNFIAIGNPKDGSWIRKYCLSEDVRSLSFLTPELRLDTGFGVLEYDMERGSSGDIPTVNAEDQ